MTQAAAKVVSATVEPRAVAERIYSAYVGSGAAEKDFSGIIRFIRG